VIALPVFSTHHYIIALHMHLQLTGMESTHVQLVGEAATLLVQCQPAHVVAEFDLVEVVEEVV
jgi:hypothetical protein